MNTLLWWLGQNLLVAALMSGFVLAIRRPLRDRPAVLHILWLLVLLKMVTPPVLVWPWTVEQMTESVWSTSDDATSTMLAVASRPVETLPRTQTTEAPLSAPLFPAADSSLGGYDASPFSWAGDASQSVSGESVATESTLSSSAPSFVENVKQHQQPDTKSASPPVVQRVGGDLGIAAAWSLAVVWLVGAVIRLTLDSRRLWRQQRALDGCRPARPELEQTVTRCAARLRIRPPSVLVGEVASPFLWCLGRVRLIWPKTLEDRRGVARSEGVLAHELAHLRRRDHWVAWLELTAGVIWWWNPLLWFVRRQLREAAEMACDAVAVQVCGDRRSYAELFLELSSGMKRGTPAPVLGVSTGAPGSFERRLSMILSERVSGKLTPWGAATVLGFAALALPGWSLAQRSDDSGAKAKVAKAAEAPQDNADKAKTAKTRLAKEQLAKAQAQESKANKAVLQAKKKRAAAPEGQAVLAKAKANFAKVRARYPDAAQNDPLLQKLEQAKQEHVQQVDQLKELEAQLKKTPDANGEVKLLRQQVEVLRAQLKVEALVNQRLRSRPTTDLYPAPKDTAKHPYGDYPKTARKYGQAARGYGKANLAEPLAGKKPQTYAQFPRPEKPAHDPAQEKLKRDLAQIDFNAARTAYDLAAKEFNRAKKLSENSALSESELAKVEGRMQQAKYEMERAKAQLAMIFGRLGDRAAGQATAKPREVSDAFAAPKAKSKSDAQGETTAPRPKEDPFAAGDPFAGDRKKVAADPNSAPRSTLAARRDVEALKKRLSVLEEIVDLQQASYKTGDASLDSVLKARQELLAAKLELAESASERSKIRKELIDSVSEMEDIATRRYQAGQATRAELLKLKAMRLKLEAEAGR